MYSVIPLEWRPSAVRKGVGEEGLVHISMQASMHQCFSSLDAGDVTSSDLGILVESGGRVHAARKA